MRSKGCELPARGWMSLSAAADYVGLNKNVLRRAINAGELVAYQKPATYSESKRTYVLVSPEDVDAWVRSLPLASYGPMVD